jgi:site-specific DNA recombinase
MTNAAIYVRVSTSRQAERDLSMPDQIAQCRAYCEQRGWTVTDVFEEPGASALDDDRPSFQEMIFKATRPERPFGAVVVHSLSRFSRDALHSELYIRQLAKAGVQLVSITQDLSQDAGGDFIRKILNIFDEHQSRENAKHVHRAMCENARQGFWNGSKPPFGYRLFVKERRGNKDKKVLEIDEAEAEVVRLIFNMAAGGLGRIVGVQAIAARLNEQGQRRRGRLFSTSSIHDLLTSTTYRGTHYFNQFDSRAGVPRPRSQWVAVTVPAIIDETTFNTVQSLLQSRNPKRMPPRVANGPTFLAGLARCGHCGAALIQNTGKGGRYRYYCCSGRLKHGPLACKGLRMPMDKLDAIVVRELSAQVLKPERLTNLLDAYVRASDSRSDNLKVQLARLKAEQKSAEAGIARLLELVERGLMEAEDPTLRDRLVALKLQRDRCAEGARDLSKRVSSGVPTITPDKVRRFGELLESQLHHGAPELRQAYARLIMAEVRVTEERILIKGSNDRLANGAAKAEELGKPGVLSFVQEWRSLRDSNPCTQRERLVS